MAKLSVGEVFSSKKFGRYSVIEYIDSGKAYIKFDNTGSISKASAGNIRNGLVRDNMAKSVFKVGCLGNGKFRSREPKNGPCTKEYSTWSGMMFRCYGDNRDEATYRNYKDCIVCDAWHNFQTFAEWCQTQPEMIFDNSSIDKDILIKGNKLYSPETCCFVPQYINTAVTGIKHQNSTGKAGVWSFKNSFVTEITMFGAKSNLGSFANEAEASHVYNCVKNAYIGSLADVFKESISDIVFKKLKQWES